MVLNNTSIHLNKMCQYSVHFTRNIEGKPLIASKFVYRTGCMPEQA